MAKESEKKVNPRDYPPGDPPKEQSTRVTLLKVRTPEDPPSINRPEEDPPKEPKIVTLRKDRSDAPEHPRSLFTSRLLSEDEDPFKNISSRMPFSTERRVFHSRCDLCGSITHHTDKCPEERYIKGLQKNEQQISYLKGLKRQNQPIKESPAPLHPQKPTKYAVDDPNENFVAEGNTQRCCLTQVHKSYETVRKSKEEDEKEEQAPKEKAEQLEEELEEEQENGIHS
ncbi:unnamed protein product [Thlaspi arvense]|uniref:Zinc knuckle CX2CX3GHX4C domain-containing protein n=1 Tax=Thlaspi arvense TaxID=13288 RepID=A0AAU9SIN2_THLAR|nr:unnamed protein product [Thlaspi arvense]